MEASESKILIVDDQVTNRRKLSLAVRHLGHVAETTNNGAEALEILRSGTKYDLVPVSYTHLTLPTTPYV